MTYTVLWRPAAERELAQIWTDAANRSRVAHAADSLDNDLRRDPCSLGESRGGFTRIATAPPLVILFDVHVAERKVIVWDVWHSG